MIVDTPYKGSWADEEFKRTHKPIIANNICTDFKDRLIGWERIHLPLPEWFGKPAVLIPNLTTIGPIDAKWARVFNG